jgi:hypothetical protein
VLRVDRHDLFIMCSSYTRHAKNAWKRVACTERDVTTTTYACEVHRTKALFLLTAFMQIMEGGLQSPVLEPVIGLE